MVKVENRENYLKLASGEYVWISEARSGSGREKLTIHEWPVKDSDTLRPVDIPERTNKQFWGTAKVPDNAVAGIYSGQIALRTGAELIGEPQL